MDQITVCVCTYKRPFLLEHLLFGLIKQQCDKSIFNSVVVVDNDAEGSARAAVESFIQKTSKRVDYIIEPRRNISRVRNRALEYATGNLVAFIDDDEFPAPDWLFNLYHAYKRFGCEGVCGSVTPEFIGRAPFWAIGHPYFFKPQHPEGAFLSWWQTYTSNVLFNRRIFTEGIRFDERFARPVGEDIMFFRAAQQRGYRFAWTSTAKVTETVLSQKLALTWVMRRALRQGATYAKIRVQGISPLRQIFFIAEICVVIWFYTGLLFLVLVAGPRACVYVLSKLLSNIGKIIGLLFYALFEPGGSHDQ